MLYCAGVAWVTECLCSRSGKKIRGRKARTVTGAVLIAFVVTMLLTAFRPRLMASPLLAETMRCLLRLISFLVPCALLLILVRFLTRVPPFVFRKMLHIVAYTCFVVMLLAAGNWQAAALTSLLIAGIVYPILTLLEGQSWYAKLFVQKSKGEVRRSLLQLFLMFAAVISVAWGIFGKPYVAAVSILMWGMGDAAAALIGIPFGRHKVRFRSVCGKKSWEGPWPCF